MDGRDRGAGEQLPRLPDPQIPQPGEGERLAGLYLRLDGVADVPLSSHTFRSVQLHRNNRVYRFLIGVSRCELHGHPLRVTTVDLSLNWPDLREELLALLDSH